MIAFAVSIYQREKFKENKMKCNDCNQEFQLKDIQFKSNKTLKKLTESQSYLNEDESSLKLELEETIKKVSNLQIPNKIKNKIKNQKRRKLIFNKRDKKNFIIFLFDYFILLLLL